GLFRPDSSCITLNVFGIPCPFCGMSRAFREFMNFNFKESIYYNPSSVVFFLFMSVLILSVLILSFFNYKISLHFNRKTLLLFIIVIASVWLLNIFFGHH
ncbi:MAG TPA: DUF2752 domain-containing protein, partial [Ignavibacteria bacterium]|nr:DUF2752 domain-containing protein [Ignavibacteria bacterium]